ncbi:DUF6291 domain-containing protein [Ruminococcus sp.]|uniref:DUF6291 domain-containing protein n=1 Tax=Ruminococcus sp. TaxID=41978 RepID=UPI0025D874FD|nr:DUF6291 domain-containing protein [Ruminococcus sp.]MBQ9541947.1 hypothetical protein [Ruminococcus sp.]
MAEHNNFLIYKDWRLFVDFLDDESAGKLFKALFAFACDGEHTVFDNPAVNPSYLFMIKHIAENEAKYQLLCEKNAKNGAKGGRPPNNPTLPNGYDKNRPLANKADNANVNGYENGYGYENDNGYENGYENVNDNENVKENAQVGKENEKGSGEKQEGNPENRNYTQEQLQFMQDFESLKKEKCSG